MQTLVEAKVAEIIACPFHSPLHATLLPNHDFEMQPTLFYHTAAYSYSLAGV